MYKYLKRFFDIIASLILIVLLSPIAISIAIILMIQLKKTPFFYQLRPGLHGKVFKVIKFQTMLDLKDNSSKVLENSLRITKLGSILRKASLDEIPQLFNVLSGKMSFVGPRPLLVEYLELYNNEQKQRHNVRPGITGWAQINGRNKISWTKKFELDIHYVRNQSFILDMKILFLTVVKVLKASDIQQSDKITMDAFNGSN